MMNYFLVESVIPLRFGKSNNIIVCRRPEIFNQLHILSEKLQNDVSCLVDERQLQPNIVYAVYHSKRKQWLRAMIKFIRSNDNVPVLELIDDAGLMEKIRVRKIEDPSLRDLKCGEVKMVIYGIGPYVADKEFDMFFNALIKDEKVTAIMTLLEAKSNRVHESYVGDLLYEFRSQHHSFREALIRERISYPSRVKDDINCRILKKRAEWMGIQNKGNTLVRKEVTSNEPIIEVVCDRFPLYEILGEGPVIYFSFSKFFFFSVICN